MSVEVKMPQLGETVVEGTITRWLKREGETVEADESLLEVSTDKVDSEIPSPVAGKVAKLLVPEGETVQVGTVLAQIESEAPGAPAPRPAPAKVDGEAKAPPAPPAPAPAPPAAPEPSAPEPSAPEPSAPGPAAPVQPAAPDPAPAAAGGVAASPDEPRRAVLSPLVRKLASEKGVDLARVRGSGTGGRITKADVLAYAAGNRPGPATPQVAPAPLSELVGGDEVIEVGHMRKAIAGHMVKSHLETARAWNAVEVDMGRVSVLRERAGGAFKQMEGFSLTWMPFICKAVVRALLEFPQVNATWNDDGTITRKHYANLGIAVALENGLIVPVIKGAESMSLVGLARAVRDLATRARSKKLSPDDVQAGTFTITNPGPFGSVLSVPIINKGQAGILAVDAVTKRPVVVTDEFGLDSLAIRPVVFISMSWDHRIIDGAEAAQFLGRLKAVLEEGDFEAELSAYLPAG